MKARDRAREKWKKNPKTPKVVRRVGKTYYVDSDPTPRVPRGGPKR